MMSGLTPAVVKDLDNVSPYLLLLCVALIVVDRCDSLVDLSTPSDECGSHLHALVLDVESCNQLAGRPDCK